MQDFVQFWVSFIGHFGELALGLLLDHWYTNCLFRDTNSLFSCTALYKVYLCILIHTHLSISLYNTVFFINVQFVDMIGRTLYEVRAYADMDLDYIVLDHVKPISLKTTQCILPNYVLCACDPIQLEYTASSKKLGGFNFQQSRCLSRLFACETNASRMANMLNYNRIVSSFK